MSQANSLHFNRSRVLVVGDAMLDRYWHGQVRRISPEAPVPIMEVERDDMSRPGGAANVACNLVALGARPVLCGMIADDADGRTLRGLLDELGIRCEWQMARDGATVTKLRLIGNQQQLMRLDFERPFSDADADGLAARAIAQMDDGIDLVLLSDYRKGALRDPGQLIDAARSRGLPVLVDPKGGDFSRYRDATLLTPNRRELEQAVGACADEAALRERAMAALGELGLAHLLVTRGAEGATLFSRDAAEPLHVVAEASEVYDVTGAGDTMIATVGAALGAGHPMAEAVRLANTAAGIVVGHLGTASVTEAELLARLARQP